VVQQLRIQETTVRRERDRDDIDEVVRFQRRDALVRGEIDDR
jgi:hypothetical protein